MKADCLGRCISFGDFELYPEAGKLYRLGYRMTKARPQEVAFLTILVEHAGAKVTKEEIATRLWPNETPAKNRLNVVVSDTRSALGDTNQEPRRYIATLGDDGYCFIHPIKRVERATGDYNDVQAEQAYRAGQCYFDKRDESFLRESVACFKRAIDHNPSHTEAWVGFANAQIMMGIHCVEAPDEAFRRARAAAENAARIEPLMPEALTALAWVRLCYDRDWEGAADGFGRALVAKPNYPFAHNGLALLHLVTGHVNDNIASLQRASRLSPLSAPLNALLSHALYIARRHEEALDSAWKAVMSDPDSCIVHSSLAHALMQVGRCHEALHHFEMARQLSHDSKVYVGFWAYCSALLGNRKDSEVAIAKLTSLSSHEYVPSYFVALIHLGLGHTEQAIDWLKRAGDERSHWVLFLNSDPIFDSVRRHPRFFELLEMVGFPNEVVGPAK
jgi:DNA-binding winged helix-turn-helix (wHTH) protein/Flp pilus assembly protein TadD